MIFYFCHNLSCILLVFAYDVLRYIPPLIAFSTIDSISISVNNSSFTFVILKAACHTNPGAERHFAGST